MIEFDNWIHWHISDTFHEHLLLHLRIYWNLRREKLSRIGIEWANRWIWMLKKVKVFEDSLDAVTMMDNSYGFGDFIQYSSSCSHSSFHRFSLNWVFWTSMQYCEELENKNWRYCNQCYPLVCFIKVRFLDFFCNGLELNLGQSWNWGFRIIAWVFCSNIHAWCICPQ